MVNSGHESTDSIMNENFTIFTSTIFGVIPNRFKTYFRSIERNGSSYENFCLYHPLRLLELFSMNKYNDLIGKKFSRLTITEILKCVPPNTHTKVKAFCECGNKGEFFLKQLKSGKTKSCGCARGAKKKHGLSHTKLDTTYKNMVSRCYNKTNIAYYNYGGRGIRVCEEWLSNKMSFLSWALSNGYKDELTIDRTNVNGDYSPDNCRFVTNKENANNKRNTYFIEHNGIIKTASEWVGNDAGMSRVLYNRIKRGWDFEKALSQPVNNNKIVLPYKGEAKELSEWSKETGIKPDTLFSRVKKGWSAEMVIETPVNALKGKRK